MSQSSMLHARRKKQKAKKHLTKLAKRAKKLMEQGAKTKGAQASVK